MGHRSFEPGIFELARHYNQLARGADSDQASPAKKARALDRDAENWRDIGAVIDQFGQGKNPPHIEEFMPGMTSDRVKAMSDEERQAAYHLHRNAFRLFETSNGLYAASENPGRAENDLTLRRMQDFFVKDWKKEGEHYTRSVTSEADFDMLERMLARVTEAHTGHMHSRRTKLPNGMTFGGHPQVKFDDAARSITVEASLMDGILQRERGRDKSGS